MAMEVNLVADVNLKGNVKYRASPMSNATEIWKDGTVANSALTNANIYANNSIELSCPQGTCAKATHIRIGHSDTTVDGQTPTTEIVGQITSLQYINQNNTLVSYIVDHFTSAQQTALMRADFFQSAFGHCSRTSLSYAGQSSVNQQPEPYSGGDYTAFDNPASTTAQSLFGSFTGVHAPVTSGDLMGNGLSLVLWISAFACSAITGAGGAANAWANGLPCTKQTITEVDEFGENAPAGSGVDLWYGAYTSGVPIIFKNGDFLGDYISAMLSNVGERIVIPADGITNDGTIRRYLNVDSQNMYAPQVFDTEMQGELENIDMEQVRVVTSEDIYRIQIIPDVFCNSHADVINNTQDFDLGKSLGNFIATGAEANDKSKAIMFPHYYHELVTACGNRTSILPQIHWTGTGYDKTSTVTIRQRFIGGDTPRAQLAVCPNANLTLQWITVVEYPSVNWDVKSNSAQQIAQVASRFTRTADIQNAVEGASTEGMGFVYGMRGGKTADTQNIIQKLATQLGNAAGQNWSQRGEGGASFNPGNSLIGLQSSQQTALNAKTRSTNATNIVSSGAGQLLGNDCYAMLTAPAIEIFRRGKSDGEIWGLCRLFERKGQSFHGNINPLDNSGSYFGGNATTTNYLGKTYYEFLDLDVVGTMPVEFKEEIEAMFCGGCYLIG